MDNSNTLLNDVVHENKEVEVKESESKDIDVMFNGVLDTIGQFRNQITSLNAQIKILEKFVKKEIKHLKKETDKNKQKIKRKPSGFAEPTVISNDLCEFMELEVGSKLARTEVTKFICSYIKENKLDNGRDITPDNKLKNLLGVKPTDSVTFFNIQRHMNKHFIKSNEANSS